MKNLILSCLFILLNLSVFANSSVRGKVLEENGSPLAYGNVILYNAADSAMTKVELTEEDGTFRFSNLEQKAYFITISYVGLPDFTTEKFTVDQKEVTLPDIQMQAPGTDLEEVTVTAQRPLLELKPDKMIFNVEGSCGSLPGWWLTIMTKSR